MTHPDRRSFLRGVSGAAVVALASELELGRAYRPAEPVDVALVGYGSQGRRLLTELGKFEGANIAGVCDLDESRRSSASRRIRDLALFADHGALFDALAPGSCVIVATPTHAHREVAVAALERGLHVYCEAPLAHTVDDARAIAAAARGTERVFQTGMLGRANPIYGLARKFFLSGAIRDAVSMRAQHHEKASWRKPTRSADEDAERNWRLDPGVSLGLEGEAGVHQYDVFHWLLGEYPTRVSGRGTTRLHDDGRSMPDTVHVELDFDSGLRANYEATLANSFEKRYELVHGTLGTLKLAWTAGWMFKEADAETRGWEVYANRQQFHDEQGITLIADATQLAAQDKLKDGVGLPNPPAYYGLATFLESVTEGADVVCTAAEGYRAVVVAEAAHRAVTTGEPVTIAAEQYEVG